MRKGRMTLLQSIRQHKTILIICHLITITWYISDINYVKNTCPSLCYVMCWNHNCCLLLDVLSLNCNGTYSETPVYHYGTEEHLRFLSVLIKVIFTCLWLFFVQSNRPQCRMPLTSILTANFHHTTQYVSSLCTSVPSLSRATPQHPSL